MIQSVSHIRVSIPWYKLPMYVFCVENLVSFKIRIKIHEYQIQNRQQRNLYKTFKNQYDLNAF